MLPEETKTYNTESQEVLTMGHYSNPTENAAIGSVDRELRQMQKWAAQIKERRKRNQLTPQELARARKAFVGIYRRFLLEALADN